MSKAGDDPRVKPHVRAAAREIETLFGLPNIGGFATSGHITNSDHYKGLALDVMTTLKGQQVAEWAQANAARLGITYIIWNRRIWDSRNGKGWTRYYGSSPHTDHVHISFSPKGGDGSAPVNSLTSGMNNQTEMPGCLGKLLDLFNPLT